MSYGVIVRRHPSNAEGEKGPDRLERLERVAF